MKNDDDFSWKELAFAAISTVKVIFVACLITAILLGIGSILI